MRKQNPAASSEEIGAHKGDDLRDDGRRLSSLVLGSCAAGLVLLQIWVGFSWFGTGAALLLVGKLVLADQHRRRVVLLDPPPSLRVCAVMPLHNEDPGYAVAGVASLLAQTRPVDRIHVIDDGSTDGAAASSAVRHHLMAHAADREWEVTVLPVNVGKRRALAHGFLADGEADIYLCVDSDTVLEPEAVWEGLRPFAKDGVAAVAGVVSAHNWRRNLLTRLIDLRYVSAFLAERAAYSAFGAVLCCCGSLSFYRGVVVRDNLDDFLGQRFLGRDATFGDDRRLTNYALRAGRVVLAERSQAATAVPERFSHYLRQQVRWNKSFFRESLWVLSTFPFRSMAFWLTAGEMTTWLVMGAALMLGVLAIPLATFEHPGLVPFVFVAVAAWARNTAYLERHRADVTRRERVQVFLLAPLYGILHLVVLLPLRLYALATLRHETWGTRHAVEVRFQA
jgi:hyaluronan synthase